MEVCSCRCYSTMKHIMVGYEKNDFFFLQTTSTKNHSVNHFSVSTFIELPKTKTEKRKMTDERKEGG
jgi:hypothetical protein